jgi:hypothetical protein
MLTPGEKFRQNYRLHRFAASGAEGITVSFL